MRTPSKRCAPARGWRYHQARELCSTKFDPEAFDREAVNAALAALAIPTDTPTDQARAAP